MRTDVKDIILLDLITSGCQSKEEDNENDQRSNNKAGSNSTLTL